MDDLRWCFAVLQKNYFGEEELNKNFEEHVSEV